MTEQDRTRERPDVLVVLTDQQTADAMSAAGNPYLATPHMDELAAAGTRYRQAYCAQPLCAPSRASLLTGQLPSALGVTGNEGALGGDGGNHGDSDGDSAGGPQPLLGRLFAEAGYDCVYGGKWHLPELDLPEGRGFRRLHPAGDDEGLARAAATFLSHPRPRPFLLVLSFLEPHGICEWARGQAPKTGPLPAPPPVEHCPPLPANFPPAPYEARLPRLAQRAWAHTHPTAEWREDDWRRYRQAYYALVERVDANLGTVLAGLREHRRWSGRETVVAFTSDHGDGAGAHGWNQKWALFEESVRVPLLVSGPGLAAGAVSDRLVSTGPDLIPTLCDLAGLAAPPGLPGRSVRAPEPRETVVAETRWELPGFNNALGRMIRDQRHKYVCYAWGDHREQLFDLAADPGEMVNLAVDARNSELLDRFRGLLAEHCARTGDPFARFVPTPTAG
ncbi:sulfatase-like hydrolase/transferase [Kitasatospora sp. NPDC093806]|uniref:sulfatase family protein n=1 Tax=Kitasatospora sp. NPDC093806 TaxID=3155075 RepID=UPI0034208666